MLLEIVRLIGNPINGIVSACDRLPLPVVGFPTEILVLGSVNVTYPRSNYPAHVQCVHEW